VLWWLRGILWLRRLGYAFTIFVIGSSLLLVSALMMIVMTFDQPTSQVPSLQSIACDVPAPKLSSSQLSSEQLRNAATIIQVGKQQRVPPYGWTIAIATAMQESTLRNLSYGDRDSVGLFQQRAPWGSFAERTHPPTSTSMFLNGGQGGQPGLLDIANWQSLPLTVAAQRVQRSAFPNAYARWERLATELVKSAGGTVPTSGCVVRAPGTWTLPIDRGAYHLTARFGQCSALWRACHTGLDFAAATGTTVRTASSGRVSFIGSKGAYGNLTKIQHATGVETYYAHQSVIDVRVGQFVTAGTPIGRVGATGNVTGPHLHFEVRVDGIPRDPYAWLTQHNVRP